jgi:hypothetical protein
MLAETQRRAGHTCDEEEKIPNPARIRNAAGDLAITSHCTDQTTSAFLLHTVLILFVIAVDRYVNHLSETVYRLLEIPFLYLRNNLFLASIYPVLPCTHLMVERRHGNSMGRLLQMKVCTYRDRLKINAIWQTLRVTTASGECLIS